MTTAPRHGKAPRLRPARSSRGPAGPGPGTSCRRAVLATYRPAEAIVREHPLRSVKQELQTHEQCHELSLDLLSQTAVAEYLTTRFPRCPFADVLARRLHTHTDGNPLFLVNVVEYLVVQGKLLAREGTWELAGSMTEIEVGVPEGLRQMIERQADRLGAQDRRLLEVASVVGAEFTAAAVASALGKDTEAVEGLCQGLCAVNSF